MIIRIKDRSELAAEARVYVDDSPPRRHYFGVYVWETPAALEAATPGDALPVPAELGRDGTGDVVGKCCHAPHRIAIDGSETPAPPPPKLGEIHLVAGRWTMEIVAHECLHATLGSARHIGPREISDDQDGEERLCYRHGQMVDSLYRWLWEKDSQRGTT